MGGAGAWRVTWKAGRLLVLLLVLVAVTWFVNVGPLAVRLDAPGPFIARATVEAVSAPSIVRVVGARCPGPSSVDDGLSNQGTGWVVRPDLVVTNAHVVVGEPHPRLVHPSIDARGGAADGTVVAFDARADLALVRFPDGVRLPSLALADEIDAGQVGLLVGFAEVGDRIQPIHVGPVRRQLTRDIYGDLTVKRVRFVRGSLQHGSSGAPILDADGRVTGTLNAGTDDGATGTTLGYAVPNEIVEATVAALAPAPRPVTPGPCID